MIRWTVSRLLGRLCPVCDGHFHDLERHWAVDHLRFGLETRSAA
ncbi:hypothetical protein [Nocardioides sp. MH1]